MIEVRVEVRGDKVIVGAFKDVAAKIRRDGLKEIADAAVASITRRVKNGYDEDDRPIKPSRRVKMHGGITLWHEGLMMGAMRRISATSTRAKIGFGSATENNKAWWHQHGTTRKSGAVGLPKRRFFGISTNDERSIQRAADSFMARLAAESGL